MPEPKKPRIGGIEESSVLTSARAFLAAAKAGTPAAPSSSEPTIAPVCPKQIILPGMGGNSSDDSDSDSDDEASGGRLSPHVSMELGLGVFDVEGSADPLLQQGVQEAD